MNFDTHREWVKRQKENITEITQDRTNSTRGQIKSSRVASLLVAQLEGRSNSTMEQVSVDQKTSNISRQIDGPVAKAAAMAPRSEIQPTATDIVLGRGRWFQDFPGNTMFREHLEERNLEYNQANRAEKVKMTKSIVNELRESGRKFLKLEQNTIGHDVWKEVDDREIYKKVSQCYRTVRKKDGGKH